MIWIITGEIRSGKTTLLQRIVNKLGSNRVKGIVAPSEERKSNVVGYYAVVLPQGKRVRIVSRKGKGERVGRFVMLDEGKREVMKMLSSKQGNPDLFVFDEFGPLELKGKGLRTIFDNFLKNVEMGVVVVRKSLLQDFIHLIGDEKQYRIIEIGTGREHEMVNEVVKMMGRRSS